MAPSKERGTPGPIKEEELPCLNTPAGPPCQNLPFQTPEGHTLSASLFNQDLAPTKMKGRRWSSYSIFTLWANDVHSLGNYAFAIGLFALGLGGWQILLALGIGAVLLFGLLNFSGFMGFKTGVPFPVMSRISFGIKGAHIASLLRGGVAIVWFGVQTFLASVVLRVMLTALFPTLQALGHQLHSWAVNPWLAGLHCAVDCPGLHCQLRHGHDPQV